MSHLLLRPFDVFMYKDRPAIILSPSMDTSSRTRKYSELYVDCGYVNEDGSIGDHFTLDRSAFQEKGTIQLIDGAEAKVVVKLPPDIAQQVKEYREQAEAKKNVNFDDPLSGKDEFHPSYGCIRLSKYSGNSRLFMSPFRHQHFIGIAISRAKRYRSLSNDRMHGELRSVVEIFMSEAQFAHFITSATDGGGTPCTIHCVTSTYMPEPPGGDEIEAFHEDVEKSAVKAVSIFQKAIDKSFELVNKGKAGKKELHELWNLLLASKRSIEDSMPFIVKQMRERMGQVAADAHTEIEAYMQRAVTALGMKALGADMPVKLLDRSKDKP